MAVQGIPVTVVSKKMGIPLTTLNKWARAEGWTKLRQTFEADQTAVHRSIVEKAAEEARNGAAQDLATSVRNLRAVPQVADLDALGKRARVINDLVTAGSKLFGWGEEGKALQLFAFVQRGDRLSGPQLSSLSSPPVDVEQVKDGVCSNSAAPTDQAGSADQAQDDKHAFLPPAPQAEEGAAPLSGPPSSIHTPP